MTNNRMPKVGKRYRSKSNLQTYWAIPDACHEEMLRMCCEETPHYDERIYKHNSWTFFEELPQEEKSPEPDISKMETTEKKELNCDLEFSQKTGATTCKNCGYYKNFYVIKGCEKAENVKEEKGRVREENREADLALLNEAKEYLNPKRFDPSIEDLAVAIELIIEVLEGKRK